MPVRTYKTKKGWSVKEVGRKGPAKKGRTHKTKAKAVKQVQAINLSLMRQGKIKKKKK